jgi:large subunit ribosomal protein L14e
MTYIQVGRAVRILRGPRTDKIAVVTAIIDASRVLVENTEDKSMWRHVQSVKNIEPLKFTVKVGPNASSKSVKEAMASGKVMEKYSKTGKAKKIAAAKALALSTDFERYQLVAAKRQRAVLSRKIFAEADAKKAVSPDAVKLAKLEKVHKKFADKKNAARHERIKKYFTALKAKKAKKGKGTKTGKK